MSKVFATHIILFDLNIMIMEDYIIMETMYYVVDSIDGDYANLKRTDKEVDDLLLVARALLPEDIKVGTKLKYEMLQYEIID